MSKLTDILNKQSIVKWLIGLMTSGLSFSFVFYLGTLVIQDTDWYKEFDTTSKFRKHVVKEILPKSDSINTWQSSKITILLEADEKEKEAKKDSYQVGLRYNVAKGKLYFRDELKEFREIKHDATGDYYRDKDDRKVYINYKY